MQETELHSQYYKKAKLYYRVSLLLLLWIVLFSGIVKQIRLNTIIQALIILLPVLAIVLLIPIGAFFLAKSYVVKEQFNRYKILYVAGYLLFIIFLIFILSDAVRFVL